MVMQSFLLYLAKSYLYACLLDEAWSLQQWCVSYTESFDKVYVAFCFYLYLGKTVFTSTSYTYYDAKLAI